ncbi:MAG: 4-alpha-glucanotransferase [Oscillospiraceae bacterium]|nr:4-alpha-glucanotransferase [Oscillospiraceae bacterium]
MKRSAGVLLSMSSLPSKYGIGCFSREAYEFIDFLKSAGQKYWQILPLGHTGYGDSPYQAFSSFAGNPYFIDPDSLLKDGLLTEDECKKAVLGEGDVDYGAVYETRYPLLKKAYGRWHADSGFKKFRTSEKWLSEYALFMALKDSFGGKPWSEWDNDIRRGEPQAVERYRRKLEKEIVFYEFIQYEFFKQWRQLKNYASSAGVEIIGDIPIYCALDSADVWSAPELFQLDGDNVPIAAAGCPPDGFSAEGQLWGNPLYDWEQHRETGYSWWISRLSHCFKLYDVVRIDHFRGFDEYFSIPWGSRNALNGKWKKACGRELFKAAEKALGKKEIIAEDLGFMTDSVKRLVKACGFPNMKVLEFAFDSRDTGNREDYLPHNYGRNCAAYTGTHDNQTIQAWFKTISDGERQAARDYLCDSFTPDDKLYKAFIALVMRSRADLCIIPMQDWLGLDDTSRMNTPSTSEGNWKWRLEKSSLTKELCSEMKKMTEIYGRC